MTKSIEAQAMEYSPLDFKQNAFLEGAKARDEQWLKVVNELREALDKMTDHGLNHYEDCDYMEYEEDERICNCSVGKVNRDCIESLTKAYQMIKEMGIK